MSEGDSNSCSGAVLRPGSSEAPALLVPGVYRLVYVHHQTVLAFGRQPKVEITFSIADPGAMGEQLRRFYRVNRLISKPKKNGTFKAGWHGELLHEFVTLFGERPERLDRIPLTRFRNRIVRGRVHTVTHTSKQRELPELLQYSVIDSLLSVEQ